MLFCNRPHETNGTTLTPPPSLPQMPRSVLLARGQWTAPDDPFGQGQEREWRGSFLPGLTAILLMCFQVRRKYLMSLYQLLGYHGFEDNRVLSQDELVDFHRLSRLQHDVEVSVLLTPGDFGVLFGGHSHSVFRDHQLNSNWSWLTSCRANR